MASATESWAEQELFEFWSRPLDLHRSYPPDFSCHQHTNHLIWLHLLPWLKQMKMIQRRNEFYEKFIFGYRQKKNHARFKVQSIKFLISNDCQLKNLFVFFSYVSFVWYDNQKLHSHSLIFQNIPSFVTYFRTFFIASEMIISNNVIFKL